MTKSKIQAVIREVNKINYDNRKKPEFAKAASADALFAFLEKENISKELFLDQLQDKLEDSTNAVYLSTMIEMLNQYV